MTDNPSPTPTPHQAPVILSDEPGSFAHEVLAKRHPALIQRVRDAFPYSRRQHKALDTLLDEITNGVVEPLAPSAPSDPSVPSAHDHEQWAEWGREHFGRPWFDAPFLWAESYFYRRLLEAVEYFGTGPWQGVDPFAPFKQAELLTPAVHQELQALDALASTPADQRATALLHASLWGNRADLGFRVTQANPTPAAATNALVANDESALWRLLPATADSTIAVIADNAGRELIPDLILIDHLLTHRHAARAILHLKPHPYYVSDATPTDTIDSLRLLTQAPGEAGAIGHRLQAAMATDRLEIRTHPFFCAPLPYANMPDDLRDQLSTATLTILKGDLNYRRLVGDHLWDPTTPFADLTAHFPTPVAALRTLKSDVITGLDQKTLDTLERSGSAWRTSGTHALIQVRR
ncbi:hypothetical protein GCM10010387_01860 [Streptomyces inusitatus]|uniref:Damage-control phosphatase ARMT1-like metal-binding domain-containing protein n=1 Tax=Streptomyces inusitatus TaxID=68221 RepID=A0A918PL66_9ACTN|nr:damage-control phosphatase ARMT1 family protein [Streptomyces inusitatus]GGZ13456.1 hypothetical protein GCM10010387_01860 [Streptomyces inusitatus]